MIMMYCMSIFRLGSQVTQCHTHCHCQCYTQTHSMNDHTGTIIYSVLFYEYERVTVSVSD